MDIVGLVVFAHLLLDTVAMISHFDDHRQHLLKQKWRTLELMDLEAKTVLEQAKENVNQLRTKIVVLMTARITRFHNEVFQIILPKLQGVQAPRQNGDDQLGNALDEVTWKFTIQCWNMMENIEDLTVPMFEEFMEAHPDVELLRNKTQVSRDRMWKEGVRKVLGTPTKAVRKLIEDDGSYRKHGSFMLQRSSTLKRHLSFGPDQSRNSTFEGELAEECMAPVQEVLSLPDRLEERVVAGMESLKTREGRGRHFGIGTAPWGGAGNQCFIPLVVSAPCRCICALCSCHRRNVCMSSTTYPKRFVFGPFWMQISSYLHERLLMGLGLCLVFMVSYSLEAVEKYHHCGGTELWTDFYTFQCVYAESKKLTAVFALLVNVPSILFSLYNIERLDAVLDTVRTIWQLEDIQTAVRDFNARVDGVSAQVKLLNDIETVILQRLDIILKFGRFVATWEVNDDPRQLLSATTAFVNFLSSASSKLDVRKWHQLSEEERQRRVAWVTNTGDELSAHNFVRQPENSVVDMPSGTWVEMTSTWEATEP